MGIGGVGGAAPCGLQEVPEVDWGSRIVRNEEVISGESAKNKIFPRGHVPS